MSENIKLYAPSDFCGGSVEGAAIRLEEDGSVTVSDALASILIAHGFRMHSDQSLFEFEKGQALLGGPHVDIKEKESVLMLDRRGLFAFLRARGVKAQSKMTNEELRILASKLIS